MRARRWLLSGAVLCLAAAAVVQVVSSARASGTWDCTNSASLFTVTAAETAVHSINTTTGIVEVTRTLPHQIGGVAYNPSDGLVYGWDQQARAIVRITSDLGVTTVATSAAITRQFMTLTEIDADGQMWLSSTNPNDSSTRPWFRIDLAQGSATFGDVVDSGNWAPPAGFYVPADWVMVGNALLGVATSHTDTSTPPRIVGLDTATGATLDHGPVSGLASGSQFGGAWMAADGRMHLTRNSGAVVAVDLATAQSEVLAENPSTASTNMDATLCGELPFRPSPTTTATLSATPGATPSESPQTVTPSESAAAAPTSLPSNPATPSPVAPEEELAPTRTGLLLQVTPHAAGLSATDRSSAVMTLVNSGNTELRNPVVAMSQGSSPRDLRCDLPTALVAGASTTCVVPFGAPASTATSTVFSARAVSGSSTLVTSMPVTLPAALTPSAPSLDVTSQVTTHAAILTLLLENTGTWSLASLGADDLELASGDPIVPVCSTAKSVLRPGATRTCELRIPLSSLRDDEGRLPRTLDVTLRAWARPLGWATPVRSKRVHHTVPLGGQ